MTISSAQRTLSRVPGRFASSFFVMMATERVSGMDRVVASEREAGWTLAEV
jgi:hypothetical protein